MVGSTTMRPLLSFSTGRPATTGLGTVPAARTIVSAAMVSSARWTLPGSMARTRVSVRRSTPRRPASTRAPYSASAGSISGMMRSPPWSRRNRTSPRSTCL